MADKFDPYREALVMETLTVWSDEYDTLELEDRAQIEQALHGDPENVDHLEYIRTPTGFCRQVTVTDEDIQRVRAG